MVVVHQSARAASRRYADVMRRCNHVTPKSYLDLVAGYRRILGEQRQHCLELAARLDGGLQKLIQVPSESSPPLSLSLSLPLSLSLCAHRLSLCGCLGIGLCGYVRAGYVTITTVLAAF
jgi:hypothetical protein